jgi:hypothetical protein
MRNHPLDMQKTRIILYSGKTIYIEIKLKRRDAFIVSHFLNSPFDQQSSWLR